MKRKYTKRTTRRGRGQGKIKEFVLDEAEFLKGSPKPTTLGVAELSGSSDAPEVGSLPPEIMVEEDTGAHKADAGKPRFDLIPPEPMFALANLYAAGAAKYGERNWEKGFSYSRLFRAMMSHCWKWWWGESHDPRDGQHHIIAVAWWAFCIYTHTIRGIGKDDRHPRDVEMTYYNPEDFK